MLEEFFDEGLIKIVTLFESHHDNVEKLLTGRLFLGECNFLWVYSEVKEFEHVERNKKIDYRRYFIFQILINNKTYTDQSSNR